MSRIYMRVFVRNESDATLTLAGQDLAHGDWTGGDWMPPATIAPGAREGFQSEGSMIAGQATTGTEGRVRYTIQSARDGGGELYIHFDSPLIESQYGNTFHVWAPPGWEVSHWGGQGTRGELEVRLRRTARRGVAGFNPRGRSFAFTNSWRGDLPVITLGFLWNRLWESLPGPLGELGIDKLADESWMPITTAAGGMCGGMVYAVMDYFHHHQLPPTRTTAPDTADDPLFQAIRDRLWASFDVLGDGHRWLGYSSPHYPNGDEGVIQVAGLARGRSWVSYREEWPKIQDDIDAGRLSPVGLIRTTDLAIGDNHQVLAYGYERSGQRVRLFIYDPNGPQLESELSFDVTATDGEVHADHLVGGKPQTKHRIWAFFRTNHYSPQPPVAGRRFSSVRDAVRATTWQDAPYSLRTAVTDGGQSSTQQWLRTR